MTETKESHRHYLAARLRSIYANKTWSTEILEAANTIDDMNAELAALKQLDQPAPAARKIELDTNLMKRKELVARINSYLSFGGLFNPELANHDAVRDLLMDVRDAIFNQPAP